MLGLEVGIRDLIGFDNHPIASWTRQRRNGERSGINLLHGSNYGRDLDGLPAARSREFGLQITGTAGSHRDRRAGVRRAAHVGKHASRWQSRWAIDAAAAKGRRIAGRAVGILSYAPTAASAAAGRSEERRVGK